VIAVTEREDEANVAGTTDEVDCTCKVKTAEVRCFTPVINATVEDGVIEDPWLVENSARPVGVEVTGGGFNTTSDTGWTDNGLTDAVVLASLLY
jgi:hypothetical protein